MGKAERVSISVITEAELRYDLARLPSASRLSPLVERFLMVVKILAWDSLAAQQYAMLRATLEHEGRPLANLDLMIAAQALSTRATLVSHDKAFQRVKGLKLADWTIP